MITYALLSPTFGMHQYTADLARRAACDLGERVRVVTTETLPEDRYPPYVELTTPIHMNGTGFSREGMDFRGYERVRAVLLAAAERGPIHFTGVHLWNVPLVFALLHRGAHVVHTLHDLQPHSRVRRGRLIRAWNRLIVASEATILVHGECFRFQLWTRGVPFHRVQYAPLLHGFWGWRSEEQVATMETAALAGAGDNNTPQDGPVVIFFGRLEWYKGIDTLVEAWTRLGQATGGRPGPGEPRLILAGRVADGLTLPTMPPRVVLRNRLISDAEALDLFRSAALLVLPYRDATQSALVAAAARLGIPSLVTRTGALAEYVEDRVTGWVVPPADPQALADALQKALADTARLRHMGRAAHFWYNEARARELDVLASLYHTAPQPVNAA